MKYSLALVTGFICLGVLISCNEDQPKDNDLALYLILPDTLNAYEAGDMPIGDLALADEPILSLDNIMTYEWSDHRFTITSSTYSRMENVLGVYGSSIDLEGLPFILSVAEKRIYLGAFWNPVSSIPPPCSAITFPPLTESPLTLIIMPPWIDSTPDQRSDPRIREALDDAGVLQE
jgi:hypothetical protein